MKIFEKKGKRSFLKVLPLKKASLSKSVATCFLPLENSVQRRLCPKRLRLSPVCFSFSRGTLSKETQSRFLSLFLFLFKGTPSKGDSVQRGLCPKETTSKEILSKKQCPRDCVPWLSTGHCLKVFNFYLRPSLKKEKAMLSKSVDHKIVFQKKFHFTKHYVS